MKLLNSKEKRSVIIKKISIVAIILLFSFISIYILNAFILNSYFKMNTFKGHVEEFVIDWDKMAEEYQKEEKDLEIIEIYHKILCNDMIRISQEYIELNDKSKAKDYLETHAFKDMFEYVMRFIEKDGREDSIDKEFIDCYVNMKR